jgi:hypothetical protein
MQRERVRDRDARGRHAPRDADDDEASDPRVCAEER